MMSKEGRSSSIPLGCLESPETTGANARIIKAVPDSGSSFVIELIHKLLSYIACIIFLPISFSVRAATMLLGIQNWIFSRGSEMESKVVLITGASSGLGEALAHTFYNEGCKLILCSRQRNKLEQVREQLLSSGSRKGNVYPPVIVQLDLEELNELEAKMETALGVYGHIDILVNNGGISFRGEITSTTLEVDVRLMKTNYFGAVALTKALLPSMIQRKSGHIVMIGSVQSKLAIPFRSAYSASKHALQAFSDSLRAEVRHHNIDVTVINPGYIRTNLSLNALTGSGNTYGQMDPTTENGLDPNEAAGQVIAAIKSRKQEVMLCSLFNKFVIFLRALFPALFFWAMARRAKKMKKQI